MNLSNYDYANEVSIDPDSLDVEWIAQPNLYIKYAEALAIAKRELEEVRTKLEVTEASLDNDIRSNYKAYLGEHAKSTESSIRSALVQQPDYQNGITEVNKAKHAVEILSAVVKAFDHKKVALENLVRLHGQNYFAGPTEPRIISKVYMDSDRSKQVNQMVAASLNRDARKVDTQEGYCEEE